ncbi:molybdopterin-dependent oxidoreductase [Tistrella bauzanensis]|uniref:molybdopterin-dependent oxidoreductase n=1 Tax=Tistrella TaxID=171436 RepID=UPI0031F70B83
MTALPPMAATRTTCPYCGVGCGVLARPDGAGGLAPVQGDPDHPANRGRLCGKGRSLADTLGGAGRLTRARLHGRPVALDAALDRVAAGFAATLARKGPSGVAFYLSGQMLTEDYYAANKLAKGFLCTANVDTNSRLCMSSTVAGHVRAFGEDLVPGAYDDLDGCDLAVLVGSNAAWCHPVLFGRLMDARGSRGTRLVVIDPRRTETAAGADLHLPIRPGGDVALYQFLLVEAARRGLIAAPAAIGLADALADARADTPDLAAAADLTGLTPDSLHRFADMVLATDRTVTLFSQGVNQSGAGTDKVNAILNLDIALGRIGRPGAGPFSLTGQPNAMGGREVGGLANQLAAHLGFSDAERAMVGRFWGTDTVATGPGLKAVEMIDALEDGRIEAIWIIGTNPAVSLPDAGRFRRALARCPLVVVSDCVTGTDTQALAHILLPAAGWSEKDGTVTNSERRISRQRAVLPAPGDALPDWRLIQAVARRLGFGHAFDWRHPSEIFDEHARLSAEAARHFGRRFDIGGLAGLGRQGYDALAPVQWPVPVSRNGPQSGPRNGQLGHAGTARLTLSGDAARMVAVRHRRPDDQPDTDFPLVLNTGRLRDQWHTMTRTGRAARLAAHSPEPCLALHPADAAAAGVQDADIATVTGRRGACLLRVIIDAGQRPGEAFAPIHWSDAFAAEAAIGRIASPVTDPLSGQPELKHAAIRVERWQADWAGVLVDRSTAAPLRRGVRLPRYWTRHAVEAGRALIMAADDGRPADADGWRSLANRLARGFGAAIDTSPPIELYDGGRGRMRIAWTGSDGRIAAVMALAPRHDDLPAVANLARLLDPAADRGPSAPPLLRLALLADHDPAGDGGVAAEPAVCACAGIGRGAILAAAGTGGDMAARLNRITETTGAGGGCGSCRGAIRELLAHDLVTA